MADFLTVEALPFLVVELFYQGNYMKGLRHIDEGISNIALVLTINR